MLVICIVLREKDIKLVYNSGQVSYMYKIDPVYMNQRQELIELLKSNGASVIRVQIDGYDFDDDTDLRLTELERIGKEAGYSLYRTTMADEYYSNGSWHLDYSIKYDINARLRKDNIMEIKTNIS